MKDMKSRIEGESSLYLGMVCLSPDSKSPATGNNKRLVYRSSIAKTKNRI
jgi:hypothetical protein